METLIAGGYLRVSDKDQEECFSLEAQRRVIERLLCERGWVLAEIYVDVHTGMTEQRPGLQRLRQDLKPRGYQVGGFHNLDRTMRNLLTLPKRCSVEHESGELEALDS